MAESCEQKHCGLIFNQVEMHLEAIKSLVKTSGHENSASFTTISHHIDQIHQVINEEKDNFRLSSSSLVVNPANQSSGMDSCQRALNNSVVLRTIMSNLRFRELLVTRLVNKNWEEEATVQLLTRCRKTKQEGYNVEVKFYWKNDKREFRNHVGSLQEFTNRCYSNPRRKFPCSQFSFVFSEKEVAAEDLINFFSKHGYRVTKLHVRLYGLGNSASAIELLRKIIFEWTPNLKFLTLDVELYQDETEPSISANIVTTEFKSSVLNQLKEFTCLFGSEDVYVDEAVVESFAFFFKDILSSAPNLTKIWDPSLRLTKEIVATGKMQVISRYKCWSYDESMVPHFEEFSRARPQLTVLKLFGPEDYEVVEYGENGPLENFLPSLERIFQSSRKTLKKLFLSGRLDGPDESGRSIQVPVMENLENFYVYNWSVAVGGGQGRILPPGYNVQDLFPRLKRLRLRGVEEEDEDDNPFNKGCNSSTTVRRLDIETIDEPDSYFNLGWISQILALYPNVRSLDLIVQYGSEVPEICRTIWEAWKESWLEELSITSYNSATDDDSDENANLPENMDQVLTGFDQELCTFLRDKHGSEHCQEEEEVEEGEFKRGPSILDMKRLKLFKLRYDELFVHPYFSRVAVTHALEPMRRRQGLKVWIDDTEIDKLMDEFGDAYFLMDQER